jgi:hypothetical protein
VGTRREYSGLGGLGGLGECLVVWNHLLRDIILDLREEFVYGDGELVTLEVKRFFARLSRFSKLRASLN